MAPPSLATASGFLALKKLCIQLHQCSANCMYLVNDAVMPGHQLLTFHAVGLEARLRGQLMCALRQQLKCSKV